VSGSAAAGRLVRSVLTVFALAAALTPWPAAAQLPPLDDLLHQYVQIAFRNEFGGLHRFGRIIKWQEPIRARIAGPNAELYKPEVERQFAILSRLTGLSMEVVDGFRPFATINMTITFVDTAGRGPADPERACFSSVHEDDGFVIRRADITITADLPELRRHCIVEEISQALGLMNDSPFLFPSIFNDDSRQAALSPWDEVMLYAHYDPRIRPGMVSDEAVPIIRQIFVQELARRNSAGTSSAGGKPPERKARPPAEPRDNPASLN
jgi:hypothetical protein